MEEDDGVKEYEQENISCLALCEGHKSDFKFLSFFSLSHSLDVDDDEGMGKGIFVYRMKKYTK